MKHVLFLLLAVLAAVGRGQKVCSYQDVLDHLNLTVANSKFRLTRPVLNHNHTTVVNLDVFLYAILSVTEKTQTFIPLVWITMDYNHEHISWDPADFCGITEVSIPHEMVWKPDLLIYEMTEKSESPNNHYVYAFHNGTIYMEMGLRIVSVCNMDVHKFPFDIQRCNISIGSYLHAMNELLLYPFSNSSRATQFSKGLMKISGEWEFLQISVSKSSMTYRQRMWDQLVYTVTVKRRPLLHVINLLLPILFFLALDMASFFIADHRGEKLGFKVTVLLAISVLLLILQDILPCTSSRTPLIATYCIVIFALMLLSLLVTILVTYLIERDSHNLHRWREKWEDGEETVKTDNFTEGNQRHILCSCFFKASDVVKQQELICISEEVSSSIQTAETNRLLLILDELKKLQKTVRLLHCCRKSGGRNALWAARINTAFFFLYVITVSLFLPLMYMEWSS